MANAFDAAGLSPPVRGSPWHRCDLFVHSMTGSIPARAGEPAQSAKARRGRYNGLSPPVRGSRVRGLPASVYPRQPSSSNRPQHGSIPARAGEPG